MVWLKCCPRCTGDLYEDRDLHGRYIACLQCGYYLSQSEETLLRYSQSLQPLRHAEETTEKVQEAALAA